MFEKNTIYKHEFNTYFVAGRRKMQFVITADADEDEKIYPDEALHIIQNNPTEEMPPIIEVAEFEDDKIPF